MKPWRTRSAHLLIPIFLTMLVHGLFQSVSAEEPKSAQVTFIISVDDLIEWSNTRDPSQIDIVLSNTYRPSESPQHIRLIINSYLNAPEIVENAKEQTIYLLPATQNKWLVVSSANGFVYVRVSEFTTTKNVGSILFKNTELPLALMLVTLDLEPGEYTTLAKISNEAETIELGNITLGYAEGTIKEVRLKQVSRLSRTWEKLSTREGVLGAAIVGLAVILIGVLRDRIKASLEKMLDLLGKYVGGKLAEKRFLKRYLENLIFQHKYLKLIGFNTAGLSRPLLEDVFVSLRIASNVAYEGSSNEPGKNSLSISFKSALKRYRCMVILGGPGAGKTTTLSYALLQFAKGTANDQLDIDEPLIPIYIPLRRLSNSGRSIIEDVIDQDLQILSPEILSEYPTNYFERKLKKGECLLLLDGLDEVLDEKTHREIAERINSLVGAYPRNRFVVTCRTAGWKDLLSGDFAVLSAQDFDREEIQRFVLGWHKAVITQSEYSRMQLDIPDKKRFEQEWEAQKEKFVRPAIDRQSRSLINAIDSNNRILAIAVNPMLLSLISLVHFNRRFLPRGRTVLYSQCLDLLIDSWDRTRDILLPGKGVTAIQKEAILREIAFDFQTRGKGEDSRGNLERLIAGIASRLGIPTPAKDLLEDIETRSGLLTERSLDVFGFTHLTLQEYLVAKHIQLNQTHVGLLERNFDNQAWREVILLYTGLVDDATELISQVAAAESLDRQLLAGYCVGDAQHCNSEVAQKIIDTLLDELARNTDRADEIVNVIAAIAADFQATPVSVEEKLSLRLIERINDEKELAIHRRFAISALGRARVTQALTSLINLLANGKDAIEQEATTAIIQFGDLALPAIKISVNPNTLYRLIHVLAGINTGSAALILVKLYDLVWDSSVQQISYSLATMMNNPLVETELLELDTAELPYPLRQLPVDRNGWSYKSAKTGFWHLDTKLRDDVVGLLLLSFHTNDETIRLDRISFKILFPAFLSFLKNLPKTWGRKPDTKIGRDLYFFTTLGFDKDEPNKLHGVISQVVTQPEIPLDLALQRISRSMEGDYAPHLPFGHRLWIGLANVYFVLFFLLMVVYEYFVIQFVRAIYYSRRSMTVGDVVTILPILVLIIFYVAAVVVAKRKLKKRFFSLQFVGLIFNPIGNFLKVLPYITKRNPMLKVVVFLFVIIGLSPFSYYMVVILEEGFSMLKLFLSSPLSVLVITEPFVFVPLTLYYWKYRVLTQNPVFELMLLHPQGRQLIGEVT